MATKAQQPLIDRLDFAVEVARAAGEVTLRHFRRRDLVVECKDDRSPVTVADRSAEELLRERIGARFPEDGIIGEEFGTTSGSTGFDWTLDPIDGTKSFIHGVPLYTTLVAVLQDEQACLGVIHVPALGETVYAAHGGGCWYSRQGQGQPEKARVSNAKTLGDGLLLTSEVEGFRQHSRADAMDAFMQLQQAARVARTWGDGYGYLMVATGRAEVMIDPVVNLWDAGPLQTIIEEAGGRFSDWRGNATVRAGDAIATNGLLHDEVLAILRRADAS